MLHLTFCLQIALAKLHPRLWQQLPDGTPWEIYNQISHVSFAASAVPYGNTQTPIGYGVNYFTTQVLGKSNAFERVGEERVKPQIYATCSSMRFTKYAS